MQGSKPWVLGGAFLTIYITLRLPLGVSSIASTFIVGGPVISFICCFFHL
jgi:hypothetical protein